MNCANKSNCNLSSSPKNSDSDEEDTSDYEEVSKKKNSSKKVFSESSMYSGITTEDKEGAVYIHIQNGYSFRTLIQFLKEIIKNGHIYFEQNRIYYIEHDKQEKTLLAFDIVTTDITKYYYYHATSTKFKIGLSFVEFWSAIKPLGKTDDLIMCKKVGESVLSLKFGSDGNNISSIRLQGIKENKIQRPDVDLTACPNFMVTLKELSKGANTIKNNKGSKFFIDTYDSYIVFRSGVDIKNTNSSHKVGHDIVDPGPSMGVSMEEMIKNSVEGGAFSSIAIHQPHLISEFTESIEKDDMDFVPDSDQKEANATVEIKELLVKCISKLSNLCESGTVKVFIRENTPIILMSNIGSMGNLTMMIRK